jgi:hypothetical protein
MQFAEIFERFAMFLRERLQLGLFTAEDSIRYTFYAALLSSGLRHTDLILEYPHPDMPGAEIDTIIRPGGQLQSVALEFKYDRANPGGTSQNRTQRAAAALVDMFRLARVPSSLANVKYFVYVTDAEMFGYFKNPANQLRDLFDVSGAQRLTLGLSVFHGHPKTFVSRIAPFVCDCELSGAFAAELSFEHHLRAFEVHVPI